MQQQNVSAEKNHYNFTAKVFKILLIIVFISFSLFSFFTIASQGVISIFENQFKTFGGIQVFLDLVIMCLLFSLWMYKDAKEKSRRFIPWFILTLIAGSIGPMFYLLTGKKNINRDLTQNLN